MNISLARVAPGRSLSAALGLTRLVAVGPVAASAMTRAGLTPAAVVARPADESIVESIRSLFDP